MSDKNPPQPPEGKIDCFLFCWRKTKRLMAHEESSYYRNRTSFWRSIYAFIEHRAFADWVAFLNAPGYESARDGDRLVWYKPLRGYITTDWEATRRVKVLKDTYRLIFANPGPAREVFVGGRGVRLAAEPLGDEEGELVIELNHQCRFKREGELSISVVCPAHGGELASIAFSFEDTDAGLVVYVGALQGGLGANPATVKSSTKAMHGLRPKAMAILALQLYLRSLGISKILAVRDLRQMSNVKHFIKTPWNRVNFNYDEAWSECGGKEVDASWYELPLSPKLKNRDEIKPNKRTLYFRRYAMIERLAAQVSSVVANCWSK